MNLKQAIIASLSAEALHKICSYLNLEVDYRSNESMAQHLMRQEAVNAESMLAFFTEAELKKVCAAIGVPFTGRKTTLINKLIKAERGPTFVAIDFETADYYPDSACALGLVRVENRKIVERVYSLIKPPRKRFVFTYLHGISWEDVANQPSFRELWPTYSPMLEGIDFFAAHNASFDRSVLHRCCASADLEPPKIPFRCTVQLARQTWNIYPTKLNNVCDHLRITLKHHQAASDAEACALIVMAAHRISK
jgi:DNA polymerase III subunit epsilon